MVSEVKEDKEPPPKGNHESGLLLEIVIPFLLAGCGKSKQKAKSRRCTDVIC